jgi:hypothetical protein
MGKDAWYLEQQGVRTDKGNYNRQIAFENRVNEFIQKPDDTGDAAQQYPSTQAFEESRTEWNMATAKKGQRRRSAAATRQDMRDMNRTNRAETVLSTAAITNGYTNKDYYERMEKNREKAVEERERVNAAREEKNQRAEKAFQESVERSRTKSKNRTPELS